MSFTDAQKAESAQREVSFRKRVYPKLVAKGSMKQFDAEREIALMQSIADDYEQRANRQATLFGDDS